MTLYKHPLRVLFYGIPKSVYYVLLITVLTWILVGLKKLEPIIYPVITDFVVEETKLINDHLFVRGAMVKNRQCDFKDVIAYSEGSIVSLEFTETKSDISRIKGIQNWGWWKVYPPVKNIVVYARHSCSTGTVVTKLFEGKVP